jgi:4-amino-4-deoxy-L-arabinose transferase-like glycosyltransferase
MSARSAARATEPRWVRYLTAAILLGLFAFHTAVNWTWTATNVTLMGWDRSSHLAKTLIYNDILREINLRSLFTALTWPWNRPPLPFLSVVPFYRLFGVSTDVALMSNCLYLAILLWSVYGIGRQLYGRRVALLAAFLVSFYPILFSISRLSYVDYALTAMVALGIYLLLKTDGFRHRGWSLTFGVGMGLGLLTKWPFIAFAGAPIAYEAWRSGALKRLLFVSWGGLEGATRLRRLVTSPWFHLLAALALTAVWYLPNWDRLSGFVLGPWLPLISWLLLACTFYVVSRRAGQGTNLLSAVLIGGTLASTWSLPNIGFSGRFVFVAFGGINIQGKGLSFLDPTFYGRYLSMMLTEQLSPLFFAALLVAVGALAYASVRKVGGWRAWRQMSREAWLLPLWLVVPFLIFTLSQTWNSRFNIALLPAAALITARGLCSIQARGLRVAIIFLLVVGGVAQCFVLSYDTLYGLSERSAVELPLLGRLNLLGEGAYIMPPNSDRTDRGYWVAPQILSVVRERAEGAASLGLLVNDTHLNADILRYQALLEFPEVEVRDLARDESGAAVYTEVFAADYVVYSTHDPYKLSDGAREAVRRIGASPGVFQQVFEPVDEYQFPDGVRIFLFRKRVPPAEPEVEEYYRHLVEGLGPTLRDEDAIVVEPPSEAGTFARFYSGSSTLYLLPTGDSAEDLLVLEEITDKHDRVHLVLRLEAEADPDHLVERWLTEHAYRARDEWYGDVRAILFASPTDEQTAPRSEEVAATLGGQISLQSMELLAETVEPGGILPVTLSWSALEEVAEDYVVFVHLLDEEGQVVAQHDGPPVGGFRPTTTWIPGETVQDRHGVLIPQDAAPGEYGLAAGLYLPATGERLPAVDGNGQGIGDSVMLGRVLIVSSEISADGKQGG